MLVFRPLTAHPQWMKLHAMDTNTPVDPGRSIDWGQTSKDYARFRPPPPPAFFTRLQRLGIGHPGQRILDLGTGTGHMALSLAWLGAQVTGIDVSPQQIQAAMTQAAAKGVHARFLVASAEAIPLDGPFDVITANQCWLYFDKDRVLQEVARLLTPDGVLCTSHFSWLPPASELVRRTEALILRYNPDWTSGGWDGHVPPVPTWAKGRLQVQMMFYEDVAVPFTRESWRGRIRASRGIGATLAPQEVAAFDRDLSAIMDDLGLGESFTVPHRLDAHVFSAPR